MKRPREHVKEDISVQILRNNIPPNWILRDITPDYGIDKSLELVEGSTVTGKEILLQLKGTEAPRIYGDHISYSLRKEHLLYYLERDTPVFLIVVDIISKRCYWIFLQRYIFDILNIEKPSWVDQQTVTVRIPLVQDVSLSLDIISDIARGGSAYILSRRINQIPSKHLTSWKTNADAIIAKSQVARDFLDKSLQLKFEVSYHYDKEGDHHKSIEVLYEIYQSAIGAKNKSSAVKAGLLIAYQLNPYGQNEVVWTWLTDIKELVEEVNNSSYNILWWGSIIETTYIKLIKDYISLLRLTLVSSYSQDKFMTPFLVSGVHEKVHQIYNAEMDFVYYLNKSYEDGEYPLYLDFLKRLAKMHWLWVYNNSLKGNPEIIYKQLKSIEDMLLFAKELSKVVSEDTKFMILLDLGYLYHSMGKFSLRDSIIEEAKILAKKLEHRGYLQDIEEVKQTFTSAPTIPYLLEFDDSKIPKGKPTFEEEEEFIKILLKDAGIDIEKGTDDLAKLARIGLKDRNPERVLKHCKHLYTEIINYGPIWDSVALPETGIKILYCEKKGSIIGISLDLLLESFKNSNCKDCAHHSPRPGEWKWTREWYRNREKPEMMKKIIENWFKH